MTKFFAWLRAKRGVAALRAATPEGERTVALGTSRRRFSEAEQTLAQLGATSVEALDKSGAVIAVFADFESEGSIAPSVVDAVADQKRKKELRELADKTAEGRMVYLVAQLIADAHRHATTVAFEHLVEVVGLHNKRGENLEKSLSHTQKVLAQLMANAREQGPVIIEQTPDEEGKEPNAIDMLVSALVQREIAKAGGIPGMPGASSQPPPKANGTANGHAPPKPAGKEKS